MEVLFRVFTSYCKNYTGHVISGPMAIVRKSKFGAGLSLLLVLPLLVLPVPFALRAQDATAHHHSVVSQGGGDTPVATVAGLKIPDIALVDQHGRTVRFYS